MIYKTIKQLLSKYAEEHQTPILLQQDAEHLILNEILQKPYFEKFPKLDLYMNEFEHLAFYNGACSSEHVSKEDFSSTGGYAMTRDEYARLERIQENLAEASCLNDLVNKFDEDDAILVRKFSETLPKDEYYGFMSMVKFRENINNDPNFEIDYDIYYGKTLLLIGVQHACSLDKEMSFSNTVDPVLRDHLLKNKGELTQDTIYIGTLKNIIKAENKTLMNAFNKKLINNPVTDANHSYDQKTIYSDLSPILNNPLIKDNTVVGIIFDKDLIGPEKLMKLYEKKYFKSMKAQFINMIDLQLAKPTIEDLNQRYNDIIEPIIEQVERQFPILNTERSSNIYYTKSDYDFNIYAGSIRNKQNILARDLFASERSLLNGAMEGYFSRVLGPVNIQLLERLSSESLAMRELNVMNYHNGVESILLLRTRSFLESDVPKVEKPNILVFEQMNFPEAFADNAFDILDNYIKEQHKLGNHIVINLKDFHSFNEKYKSKFTELEKHPNLMMCNVESFELKLSKVMEHLETHDVRERVLTSDEKTHLVLATLDKMNTELKSSIGYYSSEAYTKVRDFMNPIINEELNNGMKYRKNIQKANI